MLKILLFVPHAVDAVCINHDLVEGLAGSFSTNLSEAVDVHTVVGGGHHAVEKISDYDIIHFFGCWSREACQLSKRAYQHGIPYVLTPLGGLQPWEKERHQHSILLQQQRHLVEHAALVHVCGKLEHENFLALGWNKRVAVVKNPVLTSQITFASAAAQIVALYRKVIDSNTQLCLRPQTQELLGTLLQTGIDPHASVLNADIQKNGVGAIVQHISAFQAEDWRRILLYADQEHVSGQLFQAFDAIQVQYPSLNTQEIDRFEGKAKYPEGALVTDTLLSKNLLLKNKVKDVFANNGKAEKQLCLAMLNLHYELQHRTLPLSHLMDFYLLARFSDVDEDAVRDMIKRLGIEDFAARLTSILSSFLSLPEGFWIFQPKKGARTKRLFTAMTKFGQYNY
ncbi:MAG: glycosyltransferase [Prevotella sp.]